MPLLNNLRVMLVGDGPDNLHYGFVVTTPAVVEGVRQAVRDNPPPQIIASSGFGGNVVTLSADMVHEMVEPLPLHPVRPDETSTHAPEPDTSSGRRA